MDRISQNIAKQFNNPVMADRVLCVKIRRDGFEKLEAASRLRDSITSEDLNSTVIREYQIPVHSFLLSVSSPFFESLFYTSGMRETREKKVIINISESHSKMFMVLLESLYRPKVIFNQSIEDLLILMRVADVYDVERTLKSCQRHFVLSHLNTSDLTVQICDKALNMLDHERFQEMDIFIERCEKFLIQFFSPLDYHWNSEELISLSCTALQKVIASDELIVHREIVLEKAVRTWTNVNGVTKPIFWMFKRLIVHRAFKAIQRWASKYLSK